MTSSEDRRRMFLELCDKLRNNDPTTIKLETLPTNDEEASILMGALKDNTMLKMMILNFTPSDVGPELILFLNNFLRTSPSLQLFSMSHYGRTQDQGVYTSALLEALMHSKSLEGLGLARVALGSEKLLEMFLAAAESLSALVIRDCEPITAEIAEAASRGLWENQSLERLDWIVDSPWPVDEVLYGLHRHPCLKHLEITIALEPTGCQGVRALLQANQTLEVLVLLPLLDVQDDAMDPYHISGMKQIVAGLRRNTGLRLLKFQNAVAGTYPSFPQCPHCIQDMLEGNIGLEKLVFSGNHLSMENCSAIASGLQRNSSVEVLDLKGCVCGEDVFVGSEWQEMLQNNNVLRSMTLSQAMIGDKVVHLGQGLCFNSTIVDLDLSAAFIEDEHAVSFAQALQGNECLTKLYLDDNFIGENGGAAIADVMLGNSKLQEFSIKDNRIGQMGFQRILEHSCQSKSLVKLCVRGNGIILDEFGPMLKAAIENGLLQVLDLSDNEASSAAFNFLAEGLLTNQTLIELHLEGLQLQNSGLVKIGEALLVNSTLQTISLGSSPASFSRTNRLDADGLSSFWKMLAGMKGLRRINGVLETACDANTSVLLVDALKENCFVQEIEGLHSHICPEMRPAAKFYLDLNSFGRHLLKSPTSPGSSKMPEGIWSHLLPRMAGYESCLYYFLKHKPDLVPSAENKECGSLRTPESTG